MIIYKVTNSINNKVYIGQTICTLTKRWNEHRYAALRGNSSGKLHRAMNKYDIENFNISSIYEAEDINDLNKNEESYIVQYNAIEGGYNIKKGGLNMKHHVETIAKITEANKNRVWTVEMRKNMSEAQKKSPHNKGPKHTEEFKRQLSERNKEQWAKNPSTRQKAIDKFQQYNQSNKKPVRCIETKQEFESVADTAHQMGTSKANIRSVLKGRSKTAKGYKFEYV